MGAGGVPVRVVDAFVDSLKLGSLGFSGVMSAETGRPRYHPGDLLKLYVYGYLNQIRSNRRPERYESRETQCPSDQRCANSTPRHAGKRPKETSELAGVSLSTGPAQRR